MTAQQDRETKLIENVAAVSAVFHQDKRWQDFYEATKDRLSGFPGLWNFCADAGRAFTEIEIEKAVEWGVTHEWIQAVDAYVDYLYDHYKNTGQVPNDSTLRTMARLALFDAAS